MDYDYSSLPPHVLANILSHLSIVDFRNASETCKKLYYASCDPRIAEQLCLRFSSLPVEVDSMDIFVRPVTKLCFTYIINFAEIDYKKLLRNFGHKITELEIGYSRKLRMTQLFEMFIDLPNLKVLRLENGTKYFNPNNFDKHRRITKHKARIMRNLSRVQELHICTTETNLKGAEILLNYCSNVKKLSWNENTSIEADYFLHNVLVNRNNNCTSERLESLTVHTLDRKQNSKFFEQLIKLNRQNLCSLDLKEIGETYYDIMFKEFCKTYKSLKNLTMTGCNSLQLADVCKYMRNLKTLTLNSITATNINHIGYLNNLESLKLSRDVLTTNDYLIELIRLQPKNIVDLTINNISSVLFKEICENLPQLKRLRLELIETKDCEPLFRHLTKLEKLHLQFNEDSQINSSEIVSDPEWNVTKLVELKELYLNTFLPGFTPSLLAQLPKLKSNQYDYIYDPELPQPEEEETVNEDLADEEPEENVNDENAEEEAAEEEAAEEEAAEEVPVEEEKCEYDLMEFDIYSMWFCDSDTEINVIDK